MMKNANEADCLNCLVGSSKVSAPGLFDLKAKKHSKKKQQRKAAVAAVETNPAEDVQDT